MIEQWKKEKWDELEQYGLVMFKSPIETRTINRREIAGDMLTHHNDARYKFTEFMVKNECHSLILDEVHQALNEAITEAMEEAFSDFEGSPMESPWSSIDE